MKLRNILLFFIVCITILILPNCVQAATGVDIDGNEYEILDENTVRLTYVKPSQYTSDIDGTKYSQIALGPLIGDKNYTIVSVSENALDGIIEKQDLYVHFGTNCKNVDMETTNMDEFLKNINNVYVSTDAVEAFIETGWPEEKLQCYKITSQPQNKVVTAGNIIESDTLEISAISILGTGQVYSWYYCDENGNVTDENILGDNVTLQIPTDLPYDNENNTAKDYYFICIIGGNSPVALRSNIVKVTVNPGVYKISFYLNRDDENPIVLTVNDERKIANNDLSKIPTLDKLNQYKEGSTFVGWTTSGEAVISEGMIETTVFDKNTDFYPLWKSKIMIDANGGKFEDGKTVFSSYITNYGEWYDEPSEPTRKGYEIIDITDKKIGGKSINEYEEILEDITFYVQWKSLKGDKDITPGTGQKIMFFEVIFAISIIGLVTIFIFSKKKNKI